VVFGASGILGQERRPSLHLNLLAQVSPQSAKQGECINLSTSTVLCGINATTSGPLSIVVFGAFEDLAKKTFPAQVPPHSAKQEEVHFSAVQCRTVLLVTYSNVRPTSWYVQGSKIFKPYSTCTPLFSTVLSCPVLLCLTSGDLPSPYVLSPPGNCAGVLELGGGAHLWVRRSEMSDNDLRRPDRGVRRAGHNLISSSLVAQLSCAVLSCHTPTSDSVVPVYTTVYACPYSVTAETVTVAVYVFVTVHRSGA